MKLINIKNAIFQEPKPIDFVINGFESGTVGFLTGAGSTGKGYFAMQLAMALSDTTGTINFLDLCNEKRGKVGFLTAEDGEDILSFRLHQIGQNIGKNIKFDNEVFNAIDNNLEIITVRGKMPSLYSKFTQNMQIVNEWRTFLEKFAKDKRLLIIDTFRRFHDGDENSSGDMSEVIKYFEYLADITKCAILVTHHTNKGGNGSNNDESSSVRGSSAITDNARYQIAISKMSKEQCEVYDIEEDDRSYYVQCDIPKANYVKPIAKKWLKRIEGGVLEEIQLDKVNDKKGKSNGRSKY